jgi:hypothetical protein
MSDQLPQTRAQRSITPVEDVIPVLDSARFDHMLRIATAMAGGSLLPESLRVIKKSGADDIMLSFDEVRANCFMIVNQAARWGMDPFAVAQCVSLVKGKVCYEGKMIAALIDAKLGIRLHYEWNDAKGDAMAITVSGQYPEDPAPLLIEGTVGEWKTTGSGSPWGAMPKKMLAYRGAREWARLYAPALMLGVYSDDELEDMTEQARDRRNFAAASTALEHKPSGIMGRLSPAGAGFSLASVVAEIGPAPAAVAPSAATGPKAAEPETFELTPAAPDEDPVEVWTKALEAEVAEIESPVMLEALSSALKARADGDSGLMLAGKGIIAKRRRQLDAQPANEDTADMFAGAEA